MLEYHFERYYGGGKPIGEFELFQVGRHFASESTSEQYNIGAHIQYNYYEFTVVLGGRGVISSNGEGVEVGAGDIYVSFPSDIHEIISDKDSPIEFDFLTFNPLDKELATKLSEVAYALKNPKNRVFSDDGIKYLVDQAIAETENEDLYTPQILERICYQISVYFIRHLSDFNPREAYKPARSNDLCYKIMNKIDRGVFSIKELKEIADLTNYNYSYLSAMFKRNTGRTLSEYFISRKMQAAEQLIREGQMKLCDISDALLYSSYYSFSRAFKSYFGVGPRDFKNTLT